MTKRRQSALILVAVGANVAGTWGPPRNTIETALNVLVELGIHVVARSKLYSTPAAAYSPQADYLNAVLLIEASLGPAALLRCLKEIERRAGRRLGPKWGPRPLDLDLICFKGARNGKRRGRGKRSRHIGRPLILPHPELERRAFVLVPLADVAPDFVSLVSGRPVSRLLHALPARAIHQCNPLDQTGRACDT
ncbi:MAG: 2-amino-4-hydroxy-6-hydroxymethyldihydropteridine diphosphokinase [Hyphomicrobiaceae bacterium]|nr:MAG: 2-amino-4-hydroxy-6-hydroxymethyldihydropteridine diphosphokinase [Hyphomicrobiaceae bacterium]